MQKECKNGSVILLCHLLSVRLVEGKSEINVNKKLRKYDLL